MSNLRIGTHGAKTMKTVVCCTVAAVCAAMWSSSEAVTSARCPSPASIR